MGIPSWAVEALVRSVGSVVDRVPPEKIDHLKQRAGQWLDELPRTAARGVDSMLSGARFSKEKLDRWAKRHIALVTPVINASGCLGDRRLQGVPVGDPAIDLLLESLAAPALNTPAAADRLHRRLVQCTDRDDVDVLVAGNIDAACLAVGLSRSNRTMFIHRSQSCRLPSGTPLPDAFLPPSVGGRSEEHVREVGSVDGVSPGDLAAVPDDAILIAFDNGDKDPLWFASDEADRGSANRTRCLVMPTCGGLRCDGTDESRNWRSKSTPPLRPALDWLTEDRSGRGVDIVIVPGDGILGGPACGVILGRKETIEQIARCPVWSALQAGINTRAALAQMLEILHGSSPEVSPVIAMLTTGEENLRSRAERLVTRLSGDESIQSCRISDAPARLTPSGRWRVGSRQLLIRHRSKAASKWAEQLASDVPAVLADVEDDSLQIDLRWVQPTDDAALAAALLGDPTLAREQKPTDGQQPAAGAAADSGEPDQIP